MMVVPVFPCISRYFPVFPCISLYFPVQYRIPGESGDTTDTQGTNTKWIKSTSKLNTLEHYNYATLLFYNSTLHYTALPYTTLQYPTVHYSSIPHYTTAVPYSTLQYPML